MLHTVLIFLGAGFGGVSRYWISNAIYWIFGRQFPYGTLFVNATGCFLMGFLFILLFEKIEDADQPLRALLLIGFLGGYTTFSSFSIETLTLYENGDWPAACLNIFLNITLCILLTLSGIILGRQS